MRENNPERSEREARKGAETHNRESLTLNTIQVSAPVETDHHPKGHRRGLHRS